jgi:formate dehydrogenase iron-sulfur subunit
MAEARLKEVKATFPKARLLDPEFRRTIFLVVDDPQKYHKYAASGKPEITRFAAIKKILQPFTNLSLIAFLL